MLIDLGRRCGRGRMVFVIVGGREVVVSAAVVGGADIGVGGGIEIDLEGAVEVELDLRVGGGIESAGIPDGDDDDDDDDDDEDDDERMEEVAVGVVR